MKFFHKSLKQLTLLIPVLLLSLLFLAPKSVYAMGISPSSFDIKDILQHSSIPQTINFSRNNPSEDESAFIDTLGDAAEYIRIPNKGKFVLPKGSENTPFIFYIEPGALAPGSYEAAIRVRQDPDAKSGSGTSARSAMTMLVGAEGRIRFTVTGEAKEILAYNQPMFRNTEIGLAVPYSFRIVNSGNVDARPSRVEITMTNDADASLIYKESVSTKDIKIVKAFTSADISLLTQNKLPLGSYHAVLTFYSREQITFTSEKLKFQVVPVNTLKQQGTLTSFLSNKESYEEGEPVTLTGIFKNTGTLVTNAALSITILQDGKKIDLLRTEDGFVSISDSVTLEKIYHPLTPGTYTAIGMADYNLTKTNELQAIFTVRSKKNITADNSDIINSTILTTLFILIVLLILFLLLLIIKKIMDKRAQNNELPFANIPPMKKAPDSTDRSVTSKK